MAHKILAAFWMLTKLLIVLITVFSLINLISYSNGIHLLAIITGLFLIKWYTDQRVYIS